MTPKTIVYFERIIFGAFQLGVFRSHLGWDRESGRRIVARRLLISGLIFGLVLAGTLTLLVSGRRNKTAM